MTQNYIKYIKIHFTADNKFIFNVKDIIMDIIIKDLYDGIYFFEKVYYYITSV